MLKVNTGKHLAQINPQPSSGLQQFDTEGLTRGHHGAARKRNHWQNVCEFSGRPHTRRYAPLSVSVLNTNWQRIRCVYGEKSRKSSSRVDTSGAIKKETGWICTVAPCTLEHGLPTSCAMPRTFTRYWRFRSRNMFTQILPTSRSATATKTGRLLDF